MKTDDFDYYLPEELIAQTPLKERDHSRLLILDKETGEIIDDLSIIQPYLDKANEELGYSDKIIYGDLFRFNSSSSSTTEE